MSINLKNLGWDNTGGEVSRQPQRVVLPFTDGRTFVIVPDGNRPAPFAQNNNYGDGTDTDVIRVIEVAADGATVTERATIATGVLATPHHFMSADLFEDGSIGLVYWRSSNVVQYRKITFGTWAVSAAEAVATLADVKAIDLSVSKGDSVAIGVLQSGAANPKLRQRLYNRNTANAWVAGEVVNLVGGGTDPNTAMCEISVQHGRGGTAGSRPLLIMAAYAQQGAADSGHEIRSTVVDEAAGTMAATTLRKTYLAGDMTTKWGGVARKQYLFADGDNNDFIVAIMQGADKMNLLVAGVKWDGAAFTEDMAPQMSKAGHGRIDRLGRFAATYANKVVNFYYISDFRGFYPTPINYIARVDRASSSVVYSGPYRWDDMSNTNTDAMWPMGGTGKFAFHASAKHYMMFLRKNSNDLYTARGHRPEAAVAPTNVTPAAGTQAPSATPQVSLRGRVGKKFPQSKHKAVWQFATDTNFTINVRTFVQDDSKFVTIENTESVNSFYYFADTLPADLTLTSGTWYVRGALQDEFGVRSPWSGYNDFSLSHPPSATNLIPNSGTVLTSGNVQFGWKFSDPYPQDTQTAYQIIVEVNETGEVILDTGKQATDAKTHTANIGSEYTGVLLRWTIRLWDGDDTPGNYSPYQTFSVAAAPTVVIDLPADGGVAASATPAIKFTPTVAGGRVIKKYLVLLYDNEGNLVESSGIVETNVGTGNQLQWRPEDMLNAGDSYEARVWVADELGLQSNTDINTFTVNYVAAPSPTGMANDTSEYNTDGLAYVEVTWNDVRDADFVEWRIQRRVNELSNGVVTETGDWETVGTMTDTTGGTAMFWDFYAPSGLQVQYRVRQVVDRNGDKAISTGEPVTTANPQSSGYFLVTPSDVTTQYLTYRLSSVSDDTYTDEYDETVYTVIGRGRHVDRGDHLGVSGTLTCKVRSTPTKSARQKRREIMHSKEANETQFIRTPFGDVWPVSVGNIGVGRIAGVGTEEFVDLTIPYLEVYGEVE